MNADWNNDAQRQQYNEIMSKPPQERTDRELDFSYEMYLQEEYANGQG